LIGQLTKHQGASDPVGNKSPMMSEKRITYKYNDRDNEITIASDDRSFTIVRTPEGDFITKATNSH
jgi:hypothetical protein